MIFSDIFDQIQVILMDKFNQIILEEHTILLSFLNPLEAFNILPCLVILIFLSNCFLSEHSNILMGDIFTQIS